MTKMAAMPIYGKSTLEIFFPGATGLILMELYMKHQRPKPIIVYTNYDPRLTLTYFTAMSNYPVQKPQRKVFLCNAYCMTCLGHRFFIFCCTDFFRNKLVSGDEIKIKIKFIWTIFQLN